MRYQDAAKLINSVASVDDSTLQAMHKAVSRYEYKNDETEESTSFLRSIWDEEDRRRLVGLIRALSPTFPGITVDDEANVSEDTDGLHVSVRFPIPCEYGDKALKIMFAANGHDNDDQAIWYGVYIGDEHLLDDDARNLTEAVAAVRRFLTEAFAPLVLLILSWPNAQAGKDA